MIGIKILILSAVLLFYGIPMLIISSYGYNNLSSDCKALSLRSGLRGLMATSVITICFITTYALCKAKCKLLGDNKKEKISDLKIFFFIILGISISNLVFLSQINKILKSSDPEDIKCQTNSVDYNSMVTVGFILSSIFLILSTGFIIVPFILESRDKAKEKEIQKKAIEDTEKEKNKQKEHKRKLIMTEDEKKKEKDLEEATKELQKQQEEEQLREQNQQEAREIQLKLDKVRDQQKQVDDKAKARQKEEEKARQKEEEEQVKQAEEKLKKEEEQKKRDEEEQVKQAEEKLKKEQAKRKLEKEQAERKLRQKEQLEKLFEVTESKQQNLNQGNEVVSSLTSASINRNATYIPWTYFTKTKRKR